MLACLFFLCLWVGGCACVHACVYQCTSQGPATGPCLTLRCAACTGQASAHYQAPSMRAVPVGVFGSFHYAMVINQKLPSTHELPAFGRHVNMWQACTHMDAYVSAEAGALGLATHVEKVHTSDGMSYDWQDRHGCVKLLACLSCHAKCTP